MGESETLCGEFSDSVGRDVPELVQDRFVPADKDVTAFIEPRCERGTARPLLGVEPIGKVSSAVLSPTPIRSKDPTTLC